LADYISLQLGRSGALCKKFFSISQSSVIYYSQPFVNPLRPGGQHHSVLKSFKVNPTASLLLADLGRSGYGSYRPFAEVRPLLSTIPNRVTDAANASIQMLKN
jgi:hypothetical protein